MKAKVGDLYMSPTVIKDIFAIKIFSLVLRLLTAQLLTTPSPTTLLSPPHNCIVPTLSWTLLTPSRPASLINTMALERVLADPHAGCIKQVVTIDQAQIYCIKPSSPRRRRQPHLQAQLPNPLCLWLSQPRRVTPLHRWRCRHDQHRGLGQHWQHCRGQWNNFCTSFLIATNHWGRYRIHHQICCFLLCFCYLGISY